MAKTAALPAVLRERGVCCPARPRLGADRAEATTAVLKALADPTRLQIALILRDASEPVCICDLTATFALGQPTVSHHMAKLREAGLVESTKRSVWTYYRLARDLPPAAKRILAAL